MMRATSKHCAPSIPRGAWDPKHHNYKHVDSYAKTIAERRVWPAKRWSVGLEPRVMEDWTQYSLRNLAYAYNGKLRACSSFPEMIPLYQEMKTRGVRFDSDTAHVMLSRGARYPSMAVEDLFTLFDELVAYGAKTDLPVVEVLHTVWDHAMSADTTWREARRQQLIALYDSLCQEEIERLGSKYYHDLLATEVDRYARNMRLLGSTLSVMTWKKYIATTDSTSHLFGALSDALYGFIPKRIPRDDFPATKFPFLPKPIPQLARGGAIRRPTQSSHNTKASSPHNLAQSAAYRKEFADDIAISEILLAAVERIIDAPLTSDLRAFDEAALLVLLERFTRVTGVLVTGDLISQMLDVCKYCSTYRAEPTSMKLLQLAYTGGTAETNAGSAETGQNSRREWVTGAEAPMRDGRVIGRYLASRDPWSSQHLHINHDTGTFSRFRALQTVEGETAALSPPPTQTHPGQQPDGNLSAAQQMIDTGDRVAEQGQGQAGGASGATTSKTDKADHEGGSDNEASSSTSASSSSDSSASGGVRVTAANVYERWNSVQQLIREADVLSQLKQQQRQPQQQHQHRQQQNYRSDYVSEVFTGQMVYLRTMFLEERYPPTQEELMARGAVDVTSPAAYLSPTNKRTTAASSKMNMETCDAIFNLMMGVKRSLDKEIELSGNRSTNVPKGEWEDDDEISNPTPLVPELEFYESTLLILKHMLDFLTTVHQGDAASSSNTSSAVATRETASKLFQRVAEFRSYVIDETRTRFDGRFKMLWLQEM